MAEIIWSPEALADLAAIREFIARDAPRSATRFIQRIFSRVEQLKHFPTSGRMVPELGREDFREISIKRYRIIYRVREEKLVEIVTVYHGARLLDWQSLVEE